MKKYSGMLGLLLIIVPTFSQSTDASTIPTLDSAGERRRIQLERAGEEAYYEKEEAACYARFAVTDCLGQVQVRRRAALDKLRRQEMVLNDAERKRKALARLARIKEKAKTPDASPLQ